PEIGRLRKLPLGRQGNFLIVSIAFLLRRQKLYSAFLRANQIPGDAQDRCPGFYGCCRNHLEPLRITVKERFSHSGASSMRQSFSLLAIAAGLVLAAPALAQTPTTEDFVKKVAISDMMEIQASQLALTKNPDADTKPFAEKMVHDHQMT